MTSIERVEDHLKHELADLEAKMDDKPSKKVYKSLDQRARKIRWLLKHRWFEGDPPGYNGGVKPQPDRVCL